MNRKIKRYLDEIQKTEARIADLQNYLRGVRSALKQEENNEIIKSIRGMKLESQELIEVLNGIQDGSMTIQKFKEQNNQSIQRDASEREEEKHDESKEIQ